MGFFRKKLQPTKTKDVTKRKYKGDWPFTPDKVTLELYGSVWCCVRINNKLYALNGAAKDRFGIKSAHESRVAILNKSIGDFIKMTLELNGAST